MFEKQKKAAILTLSAALKIDDEQAAVLVDNGYLTMDDVMNADIEDLNAIKELSDDTLDAIEDARNA
ncbi:MAG: hypothetical protein IKB22_06545 [Lentisphaeria bacterium]|nr:hypothetical protein [Lentisphaeria bacterium]